MFFKQFKFSDYGRLYFSYKGNIIIYELYLNLD